MKTLARCAILAAVLLGSLNAWALINGTPPTNLPGVVTITGPHGHCTAAIVGVHPITIVTAGHCTYGATQITLDGTSFTANANHIWQNAFSMGPYYDPGYNDLAVVSFDGDPAKLPHPIDPSKDLFSVTPVSVSWGEPVSICGGGVNAQLSCGQTFLILDNQTFSFSTEIPNLSDPFPNGQPFNFDNLQSDQKVMYLHAIVQYFLGQYNSPGLRFGMGAFNAEAFDTSTLKNGLNLTGSISIVPGDSGGPWFVDVQGTHHLIAVTSGSIPLPGHQDQPLAAFSWRVDSSPSTGVLQQAAQAGADIKGL